MAEKLVLAYSGGLDTSVMIRWIKEKYGYDVISLTADVGQADDLAEIEKKSKQIGAIRHSTLDLKSEFLQDYVFPAIKANALYESKYPVSTALARRREHSSKPMQYKVAAKATTQTRRAK